MDARAVTPSSDGLGAIFPPMIYTRSCCGASACRTTTPRCAWAMKQLDDLCIEEDDTLRLQPCLSPVWDTALSLIGAGRRRRSRAIRTKSRPRCGGCSTRKCAATGDWAKTVRGVEPGGWFFEYRNGFYPDTDDTAMVLMALARTGHATRARVPAGRSPGDQLAARDAEPRRRLGRVRPRHRQARCWRRCRSPTTTRCSTRAARTSPPACSKRSATTATASASRRSIAAVAFILARQEESGAWFGRWGVNYIYGTWQVLVGLAAVGFDMTRAGGAPGGALAEGRAERRRRLGRKLPQLRRPDAPPGRASRPRRRPRGRCSACSRRARRDSARGAGRRRVPRSARRTPTAAGPRSRSPAPASRGSST